MVKVKLTGTADVINSMIQSLRNKGFHIILCTPLFEQNKTEYYCYLEILLGGYTL